MKSEKFAKPLRTIHPHPPAHETPEEGYLVKTRRVGQGHIPQVAATIAVFDQWVRAGDSSTANEAGRRPACHYCEEVGAVTESARRQIRHQDRHLDPEGDHIEALLQAFHGLSQCHFLQ